MKKTKIITSMMIMFILVISPVSAVGLGNQGFPTPGSERANQADEYVIEADENNILIPGNRLYPVKRLLENVRLNFVFSEERRVELEERIANNRIREANVLMKKGEVERAENLVNETIERFSNRLPEPALENMNRNVKIIERAGIDRVELKEEISRGRENSRRPLVIIEENNTIPTDRIREQDVHPSNNVVDRQSRELNNDVHPEDVEVQDVEEPTNILDSDETIKSEDEIVKEPRILD